MTIGYARLTVRFEAPFWTGLYERYGDGRYEAAQIIFGGEPKDQEVYQFLLEHWRQLKFSPALRREPPPLRPRNPKRARREARCQTQPAPLGTKAQQALQRQREEAKTTRQERSRAQRQAEEERRFQLRQAKKREKHKGH